MAKGANGTLDLASFTQVSKQREAIGERNLSFGNGKSYGLATDKLTGDNALWPKSPIDVSNRDEDTTNDRGALWTDADGDLYKAYAAAVDTTITGGFGFSSSDTTNLDYRGSTDEDTNPFLNDDKSEVDYNTLTTGKASEDTGDERRFFGFPDLQIPDQIDGGNIAYLNSTSTASSGLNKEPTNNFGSTTSQDREQINIIHGGSDLRGTFEADALSPADAGIAAIDTLGKYFTKNYTN